jgi:hypothetical protein
MYFYNNDETTFMESVERIVSNLKEITFDLLVSVIGIVGCGKKNSKVLLS